MPEEVITAVPVEETPKPKKERKPREKARTYEELKEVPAKKMSDKEKELVIDNLRKELEAALAKEEHLQNAVESAFARARDTEDKYSAMEVYYRKCLKYIDAQTEAFHAAVNQATKGGIQ